MEDNIQQEEYGYIPLLSRILNVSTIMSLVAAVLLIFGLTVPIIDFSVFNEGIDIQYNLLKVCENVRILSPIWNGLHYGIIAGIIILIALSFVNIPPLKIIPVVLIILMYVIMICDISNVVTWAKELVERFIGSSNSESVNISKTSITDGLMSGVYFTVAGLVLAIISCFVKGAKLVIVEQNEYEQ